ncbi:hypothetical protein M0802_014016 [Mischocyttarus mexicanus]|nr:hypothetical protein M0802_014016 [Mischocyttarus mexicanus]
MIRKEEVSSRINQTHINATEFGLNDDENKMSIVCSREWNGMELTWKARVRDDNDEYDEYDDYDDTTVLE